jgi:hypothetical protein
MDMIYAANDEHDSKFEYLSRFFLSLVTAGNPRLPVASSGKIPAPPVFVVRHLFLSGLCRVFEWTK